MQEGDFTKALSDTPNRIASEHMTQGAVPQVKPFDRKEALVALGNGEMGALLNYDLRKADLADTNLTDADLTGAKLTGANLTGAKLTGAKLDYSCLPLSCGGLGWRIDKRIACQLAYHLCSMLCDDAEYIAMRNSILPFANQFHRVEECGELMPIEVKEAAHSK